jgi:hypothetical protein
MFDTPLSDRVARLQGAYDYGVEELERSATAERTKAIRDQLAIRKLALLKVEQALLVAGF